MFQSKSEDSVLRMDRILLTAIVGILIIFCYKLYLARSYFRKLQKQGLVSDPELDNQAPTLITVADAPAPPNLWPSARNG
jgi:hypothetical protein